MSDDPIVQAVFAALELDQMERGLPFIRLEMLRDSEIAVRVARPLIEAEWQAKFDSMVSTEMSRAADEIERLRAERDRLAVENEGLLAALPMGEQEGFSHIVNRLATHFVEMQASEAGEYSTDESERDRLRAALVKIRDVYGDGPGQRIASEVLGGDA